MNGSSDDLSTTLQCWCVQPRPDPDFRPSVWRRIAQRSRESWAGYLRAHVAGWVAVVVVAVGAAGWAGSATAEARLKADREAMAADYLARLDPRLQVNLRPRSGVD